MNEQECLARMVAPGQRRPGKWMQGVIQICVTHACDKACFGCTQGSNLSAPRWEMTPEQFRTACRSLKGYFGVVGMFGGNPAMHSQFSELCEVMREEVPFERRGLWCNNPTTVEKARVMRETFNPGVSNLNVHMDQEAYRKFKQGWPQCMPVGLTTDSRHSPPFVGMRDVLHHVCFQCQGNGCSACQGSGKVYDEVRAWKLISGCDINQHWSAAIGVFRGELRAWFCEIAMSQAIHHQHEPDYPDTGLDPVKLYDDGDKAWWQLPMHSFTHQVRKHCHDCGVPLRGKGELALNDAAGKEQVSATHHAVFTPKRKGRAVELVTTTAQLGATVASTINYIGNAKL